MKKNILTLTYLVLISILTFVGCSESPVEPKEEPTLHSVIQGGGNKTIVFENGLGISLDTWNPIINEVSSIAKTLTYNRAGYLPSPELNPVRSLDNIVNELREHLTQKGLTPPYILVGHSYGGLIMHYFAKKYPGEVEGLVLLDSTPYNFISRMRNAGMPDSLYYPSAQQLNEMHPIMRSEFESIVLAEQMMNSLPTLPEIPLKVLTSSKPITNYPQEYTNLWVQLHEEIASESPLGEHIFSNEAGHYVHHDFPEFVVEKIKEIVYK